MSRALTYLISSNRALPAVAAVLLICSFSLASKASFALELGGITFPRTYPAVPHIVDYTPGDQFYRRSGGVAFTQTATPKHGWVLNRLWYDRAVPDCRRLKATLSKGAKTVEVNTSLCDWEVGPLVRFVAADTANAGQSVVTLFGGLQDKEAEARTLQTGHMIINFHPAFENTLLGLRMLHADLLLIDARAAELFQENGQNILGAGEPKPDRNFAALNRERIRAVLKWMEAHEITFNSYVVGDLGMRNQFYVEQGELKFTGVPHWAMWRHNDSTLGVNREHVAASVKQYLAKLPISDAEILVALTNSEAFAALDSVQARGVDLSSVKAREELISDAAFMKAFDRVVITVSDLWQWHPQGRSRSSNARHTPDAKARLDLVLSLYMRVRALSQEERTKRVREATQPTRFALRQSRWEDGIIRDPKASHAISLTIREHGGLNPIVYRSLQRAMNYSALLRHYRVERPRGFHELVSAIQNIDTSPMAPARMKVLTPTVYPR